MPGCLVFAGPTISAAEIVSVLDGAICLPPATQGDILRGVHDHQPDAIAIIDGCFEAVPAVTHKEILWAMGQGIPTYGSSSMGALRAAELEPLGMIGCGTIFEMFRDGELEDDDEVALSHAPAAVGYAPLSVPMVNIRVTMEAAESAGLVSSSEASRLVGFAKRLFYKNRSYEALLERAGDAGLTRARLRELADWLQTHAVDQKKLDAEHLFRQVASRFGGAPESSPSVSNCVLSPSAYWLDVAGQYLEPATIRDAVAWAEPGARSG